MSVSERLESSSPGRRVLVVVTAVTPPAVLLSAPPAFLWLIVCGASELRYLGVQRQELELALPPDNAVEWLADVLTRALCDSQLCYLD